MYFYIFNIFKKYIDILINDDVNNNHENKYIIDDDKDIINDAPFGDPEKKILSIFLGDPIIIKNLRKKLIFAIIMSFIISLIITFILMKLFNLKPYIFLFIYTIIIFISLIISFDYNVIL